jgi:5-methyltetrahydrofolate--homocysteine methyltransferase
MAKTDLKKRLQQGVFILDGGMGSQLIAREVQVSQCNDYLSMEAPDTIKAIHADYFNAGSDAVITNSFGANGISLAKYNLADQSTDLCRIAAENARAVAGDARYILGDIGPCGEFIEPLGLTKPADLKQAFMEQARGLLAGGVDGFIVETMTALEEMTLALEAVMSLDSGLPVFGSMAFDHLPVGFRTIMGVDVTTAVETLVDAGVDALGFNCGTASLGEYVSLARAFVDAVAATGKDVLIYAEPNAGKPEVVDGDVIYKVTPEEFSSAIETMHGLGIRIFGGCCGTGPEHIRAVAQVLNHR